MSQSQAQPTARSHFRYHSQNGQQLIQVQPNLNQHQDWLVIQDLDHLVKH